MSLRPSEPLRRDPNLIAHLLRADLDILALKTTPRSFRLCISISLPFRRRARPPLASPPPPHRRLFLPVAFNVPARARAWMMQSRRIGSIAGIATIRVYLMMGNAIAGLGGSGKFEGISLLVVERLIGIRKADRKMNRRRRREIQLKTPLGNSGGKDAQGEGNTHCEGSPLGSPRGRGRRGKGAESVKRPRCDMGNGWMNGRRGEFTVNGGKVLIARRLASNTPRFPFAPLPPPPPSRRIGHRRRIDGARLDVNEVLSFVCPSHPTSL